MLATPERHSVPRATDYNSLPKDIGSVPPEVLLGYTALDHPARDYSRWTNIPNSKAIAGSALIEATLIAKKVAPDFNTIQNFVYLEEAEEYLREAAEDAYELLDAGMIEANDQKDWLRASVACDFMDVYRDIAADTVCEQTAKEIIEKLVERQTYIETLLEIDDKYTTASLGVLCEVKALLYIWNEYEEGGTIAFPATARGGNGVHHSRSTHDMICAGPIDGLWNFIGIEVKGGRGLTDESRDHYDHPIMHVSGGKITIINGGNHPLLKKIPTN